MRRNRSDQFVGFVVVFGLLIALALTLYGLLNSGFGAGRHTNWLKLSGTLKKQGEPIYIADVKPADVPLRRRTFLTPQFFQACLKTRPAIRCSSEP